jgi:hypothetical protein
MMKKMNNPRLMLTCIVTAMTILLFVSYNSQSIFGHNFAGDESASFLALMDTLQTEMKLINTNIIANNQSLAKDHLDKINELYTEAIKKEISERNERVANDISSVIKEVSTSIGQEKNNQDLSQSVNNFNDIIGETISVRIDQDALNNATVQALHFADLINSIDAYYAEAVGTKPMNMSSMNMSSMNMSSMNMSSMNMEW